MAKKTDTVKINKIVAALKTCATAVKNANNAAAVLFNANKEKIKPTIKDMAATDKAIEKANAAAYETAKLIFKNFEKWEI